MHEQDYDRRLREEQDQAYQASLQADQAREREREKARLAAEAEAKAAADAEQRARSAPCPLVLAQMLWQQQADAQAGTSSEEGASFSHACLACQTGCMLHCHKSLQRSQSSSDVVSILITF